MQWPLSGYAWDLPVGLLCFKCILDESIRLQGIKPGSNRRTMCFPSNLEGKKDLVAKILALQSMANEEDADGKLALLAQEFLEAGAYKSNEDARKAGVKKEPKCTILRRLGRQKPVPYEVTDRTPTKAEWNRVVAVFVTGASWQFKDWPNEVGKLYASVDSVDMMQIARDQHM